jgi:hypothetical protein
MKRFFPKDGSGGGGASKQGGGGTAALMPDSRGDDAAEEGPTVMYTNDYDGNDGNMVFGVDEHVEHQRQVLEAAASHHGGIGHKGGEGRPGEKVGDSSSLSWMYTGGTNAALAAEEQEAYLLGKKVTDLPGAESEFTALKKLTDVLSNVAGANFISNNTGSRRTETFAVAVEDPIFAIKSKERRIKDAIAANPALAEKLRALTAPKPTPTPPQAAAAPSSRDKHGSEREHRDTRSREERRGEERRGEGRSHHHHRHHHHSSKSHRSRSPSSGSRHSRHRERSREGRRAERRGEEKRGEERHHTHHRSTSNHSRSPRRDHRDDKKRSPSPRERRDDERRGEERQGEERRGGERRSTDRRRDSRDRDDMYMYMYDRRRDHADGSRGDSRRDERRGEERRGEDNRRYNDRMYDDKRDDRRDDDRRHDARDDRRGISGRDDTRREERRGEERRGEGRGEDRHPRTSAPPHEPPQPHSHTSVNKTTNTSDTTDIILPGRREGYGLQRKDGKEVIESDPSRPRRLGPSEDMINKRADALRAAKDAAGVAGGEGSRKPLTTEEKAARLAAMAADAAAHEASTQSRLTTASHRATVEESRDAADLAARAKRLSRGLAPDLPSNVLTTDMTLEQRLRSLGAGNATRRSRDDD